MDKGAQENKLVVGSQARILYADAEGVRENCSALIRLLPRDWNHCSRTRPSRCFRNRLSLQGNIKHLRRIVLQPIWLFKT
jgi:hypothetical protein